MRTEEIVEIIKRTESELLIKKYYNELDWEYIERRAKKPENDILEELLHLKEKFKK